MVSAWFLLVAFWIGGTFGLFAFAILRAADEQDQPALGLKVRCPECEEELDLGRMEVVS